MRRQKESIFFTVKGKKVEDGIEFDFREVLYREVKACKKDLYRKKKTCKGCKTGDETGRYNDRFLHAGYECDGYVLMYRQEFKAAQAGGRTDYQRSPGINGV